MTYRAFRRTDTGQWHQALFVCDAESAPDPTAQADDLAAGLGISSSLLEHVDAESDPRSGPLLEAPVPEPVPQPPSTQEQLDALMATLVAKAVITEADAEATK